MRRDLFGKLTKAVCADEINKEEALKIKNGIKFSKTKACYCLAL